MNTSDADGQSPTQVARHFLHLLKDVNRIHGLYLEEIDHLRSRIRELEEVNSSLSTILPEVAGCAVYIVSLEGNIAAWSRGASELYGYTADEILGRPLATLRQGQAAQDSSALRTRKDGGTFQVFLHHTVMLDEEERASGRMHMEVPVWNETFDSTHREQAS